MIDNNLPCFKPIPTHCNSFAGNAKRNDDGGDDDDDDDDDGLVGGWMDGWMMMLLLLMMVVVVVVVLGRNSIYLTWVAASYRGLSAASDETLRYLFTAQVASQHLDGT